MPDRSIEPLNDSDDDAEYVRVGWEYSTLPDPSINPLFDSRPYEWDSECVNGCDGPFGIRCSVCNSPNRVPKRRSSDG